jgi:hypothetical protein
VNGKTYLAQIDNLKNGNRLLLLALLMMVVFNAMNWLSLQRARTSMQTVIVPVGGGDGMTVGNDRASPEYLRHMARHITNMVGTYTAGTARPQLQETLQLFAPEIVGKAQIEFERLASQIERFPSIASTVRWQGEEALKFRPGLLQVHVAKDRLVNGNVVESKVSYYCIKYRIDEARFWIVSIQERDGDAVDLCFLPEGSYVAPKPDVASTETVAPRAAGDGGRPVDDRALDTGRSAGAGG